MRGKLLDGQSDDPPKIPGKPPESGPRRSVALAAVLVAHGNASTYMTGYLGLRRTGALKGIAWGSLTGTLMVLPALPVLSSRCGVCEQLL